MNVISSLRYLFYFLVYLNWNNNSTGMMTENSLFGAHWAYTTICQQTNLRSAKSRDG